MNLEVRPVLRCAIRFAYAGGPDSGILDSPLSATAGSRRAWAVANPAHVVRSR